MGGPFTLTDQNGRRVSDRDFAGKYRLVYFGYTFCPDVCPADLQVIGAGAAPVRGERPGARRAGPADLHQRRSRARHAAGAAPVRRRLPSAPDRPHRQRGGDRPASRATIGIYLRARRAGRRAAAIWSTTRGWRCSTGPRASRSRIVPHDQGAGRRRRRARALGAMRERFWEQPLDALNREEWEALVRRLRQMLPAQARGRGDRRAPRRPTSPAGCSTGPAAAAPTTSCAGSSCPIACGSTPTARARSTGCPRPAPIGCAPRASRCADWHYLISGDRETRARGRHVGARLDDLGGRSRRSRTSSRRP